MFYSTEILKRKRNGFGIYWLAATLGSKGASFRKFSRKEVLACDVAKACQSLTTPEEPLALRLSSNLMCGIARVYQKQYVMHEGDVQLLHQSIKRAFGDAHKGRKKDFIDLDPQKAHAPTGNAAINLAVDPDLEILGWDAGAGFGMDWDAFRSSPALVEEEEVEGDFLDINREFTPDGTPQIARKAQQSGHRSQITLDEPYLDDYAGHSGMQDADFGFGYDNIGLGENEPGLIEGHDDELDAIIRKGTSRASGSGANSRGRWAGGSGGVASSSRGGGQDFDMGGMDAPIFDDFGGGDEFMYGNREGMEDRVMREHQEGNLHRADHGLARRESSFGMPFGQDQLGSITSGTKSHSENRKRSGAGFEDDEDQDEGYAERNRVKREPKKPKHVVVDSVIALDDDTVAANRKRYPLLMEQQKAVVEKAKFEKQERERALEAIFGVPSYLGPELADFWEKSIDLVPFGSGRYLDKKRARTVDGSEEDVEASRKHARMDGDLGGMDDQNWFIPDEYGGGDYAAQQGFGGEGAPIFDDVEQGREGRESGENARAEVVFPWNADLMTSDAGAGGLGGFGDGASSNKSRSAKVSLNIPQAQQRGRQTQSLTASPLGSLSPLAKLPSDEGLGGMDEFIFDDFGGGADAVQHSFVEKDIAIATLQEESNNFFQFAKRKVDDEPDKDLFFSDIVPVASETPSAAAYGLYHLLALVTKNLVEVEQHEAYGKIQIKIVE